MLKLVPLAKCIKLNQEKLPGCYLHRTAVNDVARVEDRTFICSKKEEDAGPTNHWMDPEKAYKMLYDIARGSYKGRTMYVIPLFHGPGRFPSGQNRHGAHRLHLRCAEHGHHDPRGPEGVGCPGRQQRLGQGLHCKCEIDAGEALYLPLPGGQHYYLRELRLRRKRAAGQKVLRSAYRLLPGQERGLDGRAYAHPGH